MTNFQTKYKILSKIGEGSFSEVIKCQNRETSEYFAAKRLKKCYKTNEGFMNCAEIIAAQKIPYHQNVLNLLEFHHDDITGKAIFIFELMDMSMYDFLKNRNRRIPEVRVKVYLYQILKGLTHLHNNGLFHRDVKPENILIKITPVGELIKLADLGSVRGIYSEPPYTEYISTRWYRSPECLLTVGNYGPKMDVWATGCVFYEMLTLRPLFPGSNELDQLHKIHSVLGTPDGQLLEKLKHKSRNCTNFPETAGTGLSPLLGGFSEQAKRLLKLMLEYDPDKRVQARRLLQSVYFDSLRYGTRRLYKKDEVEQREKSVEKNATIKRKCSSNTTTEKNNVQHKTSLDSARSKGSTNTVKKVESKVARKPQGNASKNAINATNATVSTYAKPRVHSINSVDANTIKVYNTKNYNLLADKRRHSVDTFRKTMSNLPRFVKPPVLPKEIPDTFHSKSLVQNLKKERLKQIDENKDEKRRWKY